MGAYAVLGVVLTRIAKVFVDPISSITAKM